MNDHLKREPVRAPRGAALNTCLHKLDLPFLD